MTGDPYYLRLVTILKDRISEGIYPLGSILPSISRLQSHSGFSRNTVISALKILSNEGIIQRRGTSRQGYLIVSSSNSGKYDNLPLPAKNTTSLIMPFSYWNYVGSKLLESLEAVLSRNQSHLVLKNHKNSLSLESDSIRNISRDSYQTMNGIILVTSASYSNPNINEIRELQAKIPVILLDRKINGIDSWFIGVNNHDIGQKQVEHLFRKGHRRIGYFTGFERISTMKERYDGFMAEMSHLNIPIEDRFLIREESLFEDLTALANASQILEERLPIHKDLPSAFVCGSDKGALVLYEYLKKHGVRVPEDVAIIGCDQDEFVKTKCGFAFSSFRYPFEELGYETKALLERITHNSEIPKKHIEISAVFVQGESS